MGPYSKFLFSLLAILVLSFSVKAAIPHIDTNRTRQQAKQALIFCRQRGYNTKYCILIDMSLHSGVKRFMVWDFGKNNILIAGLVSHGCGSNPWSWTWSKDKPIFSNADGSHCTALGKYQVNNRAYSIWGMHVKYFLTGLEGTNNKALGRQIVFHSWEKVPEDEVYPNGTPEGWGCPAISNNTMKVVDALISKQRKHWLLWIYN